MRIASLLAAVTLGSAGCLSERPSAPTSFWHLTYRNLVEGPVRVVNNQVFKYNAYREADRAWAAAKKEHPDTKWSWDFRDGFREGFVDYLDAGGNGEPPAVPPFRYRTPRYETPDGLRAIEDWNAGFRVGAAAAQATGLREQIVVPLASLPVSAVGAARPPAAHPDTAGPPPRAVVPPMAPAENLPPPRPLRPVLPGLPPLPEQPERPGPQGNLPAAPVPVFPAGPAGGPTQPPS